MIELDEQKLISYEGHSSKGNQLKWKNTDIWYKADYTGYEGLAEYTVSKLLEKSSLKADEFIKYETEQIGYKHSIFNGCKSRNFMEPDWQIMTLERLYKTKYNRSFMEDIWKIDIVEDRLIYMVTQVEKITGISDFGKYISKMLTIDAFFLNEDRHFHNIAVLLNHEGEMKVCPFFDHGAGLLADTTLDYPMGVDIIELIAEVKSKTVCQSFDDALDAAEKLFGQNLRFEFTGQNVKTILDEERNYAEDIRKRVESVVYQQMRKYQYLFT